MAPDEKRKLEMTVAALQQRWGRRILRRGAAPAAVPHLDTGFPALDQALGVGGWPRGQLTEITGVPTSGMATLALKGMAGAQAAGGTAITLDFTHTFDPDYAARCGVDLARLVVVRPYTLRQGLAIAADFTAAADDDALDILVCDAALAQLAGATGRRALAAGLAQLTAVLRHSRCVLLFLVSHPVPVADTPLSAAAALRLHLHKARWLYGRGDIRGYEARVQIQKNRLAAPGRPVRIAITFNGTVRGDGVADGGPDAPAGEPSEEPPPRGAA